VGVSGNARIFGKPARVESEFASLPEDARNLTKNETAAGQINARRRLFPPR
jgi:hypothetical protein